MRVQRLGRSLFVVVGMIAACADQPTTALPQTLEVAPQAKPDPEPDSDQGRTVLEQLRDRHVMYRPAAAAASKLEPVLVPGSARFARKAQWLVPVDDDAEPFQKGVELQLPVSASGAFRLTARESELGVQARLRGTTDVAGETADGYVVYPNGGPSGSTLLHRVTDDGTEDYLTFDSAPAAPEVSYQVALNEQVAGLRLVSNTLELLDASGDPKLRVAPPYLIGADGTRVEAQLAVRGCNVDTNPAEPWDRPTVDPGARSCDVDVRWDPSAVEYPAVLDPSWSSTANNMIVGRAYAASAVLTNGRVLVAGGQNPSLTTVATAEIYNPTTRTWAATGSMSSARMYAGAVTLASGRVLVVAGQNSAGVALSSALQFDSATGTFSAAGTLVTARRTGFTVTLLTNNKVLVAGGVTTTTKLTNAELYTPPASLPNPGTWAATGAMTFAQADHAAVRLTTGSLSGRVLSVGSRLNAGVIVPSVQLFNPTTNTWANTTNTQVARSNTAATVLTDGTVLVVGGTEYDAAGSAEVFNPNVATPTWTRTGSTRYPRAGATATRLSDGRVLVYGLSLASQGGGDKATEVFNPTFGTWIPSPDAATMRIGGHFSHLLSNGRVLVGGGYSLGLAPTNSAEEFISTTTATTVSEYRLLPAVMDPTVTMFEETEIWAAVYRPTTLAAGRYPVIVFQHGNHGTCGWSANPRKDDSYEYTTSGLCTDVTIAGVFRDYSVTPNHLGYAYIAHELAARGYIVVSINANRLNYNMDGPNSNDKAMILDRGNLILRHLQKLSEWDRGVQATPASIGVSLLNKLDFGRVGLMGHSRGGEAARAAYNQYWDAGSPWPGRIVTALNVRGIFEIGPVDQQEPTQRVLDAHSTRWAVLLPMCDQDVRFMWGVKPFDRMMNPDYWFEYPGFFKATYTVWGANHSYYNTEWQETDSEGCWKHRPMFTTTIGAPGITGSAEQRQSGFLPMLAFFQTAIAPNGGATVPAFEDLFDPRFPAPFAPRVDRGYSPSSEITNHNWPLEEFTENTGTSYWGTPTNTGGGLSVTHGYLPEHDSTFRGGTFSWSAVGGFFQTNFPSVDLSSLQYLDMRADRLEYLETPSDPGPNPTASTNFQVRLVNNSGTMSSPVSINSYVQLTGAIGKSLAFQHSMLQTIRIPLSAFTGATLTAIRAVRLEFNSTPTGLIGIANIRATDGRADVIPGLSMVASPASASAASAERPALPVSKAKAAPATGAVSAAPRAPGRIVRGTLASVRTTPSGTVEFDLRMNEPLLVQSELAYMQVGSVITSTIAEGDHYGTRYVFELTRAEVDSLKGGEPIIARRGRAPGAPVEWHFGTFDKTRIDR